MRRPGWQLNRNLASSKFTRDVEFERDGTVYTAIAHFPGWHVEGGQSTFIRVQRR